MDITVDLEAKETNLVDTTADLEDIVDILQHLAENTGTGVQ